DDKNEFTIPSFTGNPEADDGEVEFEVKVNIPAKFSGDLVVVAEGRALVESSELTLAEVKARVEVKVEPLKVEVGQKSNQGGKITLTETEKGMIERGKLIIQLPKDLVNDGVIFTNVDDLVLKTTGGIKVDDASLNEDTDAIEIQVRRQSTETGSIEISGFEVKSRRIIADGAYEVEIGGAALSKIADLKVIDKDDDGKTIDPKYTNLDAVTEIDFILVGDKLAKAEVTFTIGSSKFLVDNKEMTMDAAAYIKDGRTMVPLRYLATALGIDTESIKFHAGTVTIFDANSRVIQVQVGSNALVINGMSIPMVAAAEIIDGRTYVPVAEIGAVFNVTGTWDAATQTATFK
ncbi:MAG TPA: copper amine oxidase N-terminal domain-containing protein, partial [Clostridiales bacterium]|nr:copper amine oxidase N-terminal domain-containing protein [Clostridiales bacterium]